MATKVKMLKLLQEMRGFPEFTNRRPPARHPGLLTLQISQYERRRQRVQKKTIAILMQDPLDIPDPVKIKIRPSATSSAADSAAAVTSI